VVLFTLVGILGLMMVLVVIFSFLTVAKRADDDWLILARKVLEDSPDEDRQTIMVQDQITRPAEELPENRLEMVRRASA
jgi:hypothetical protein